MAQHKFGTRRRAMLSFERQPFPAPCHVNQDVAHSRAWCALRHLTTFDRVLSALHRRNHLPIPPEPLHPANAATGIAVWSASFAPGVHFETNNDLCATAYCAAGPRSMSRAIAGWISYDFEARSKSPNGEKGRGMGCRLIRPRGKLPRPDYSEASGPIEPGRPWDPMPGPSRIG
jgi:hypothetical protein